VGTFAREEIEAAFAEYRRRGVEDHDWPGWADLFTEDAHYVEHLLGTYHGRDEIKTWIVDCMKDFPSMSLWIEWWVIDQDRVFFYIWNNLPDPTGGDTRYAFPNVTIVHYAGDGLWDHEEDLYTPADANRVVGEWLKAGGTRETPRDDSLRGVDGHAPEPVAEVFPREEIEREFEAYRKRGTDAVESGDWVTWAAQFTEDARYLEHHYGRFSGRDEITEWITGVMQPFPEMDFPVTYRLIEGNRVTSLIPNRLPDPKGGDEEHAFAAAVILHYAGNGMWSYEEDVYNPDEAAEVVGRWLEAGGTLPEGFVVPELS
jgi:predicted SnoaL-like aldol condensation-catalyzing enzyme